MHILSTHINGALISGAKQYLQGPYTPKLVKMAGYGFTTDPERAWPFPSEAQAAAKARIVTRHMGWDADRITIETL